MCLRKMASKDVPDLEEAVVEESDGEVEVKNDDENDLSKDKFIKAPRRRLLERRGL